MTPKRSALRTINEVRIDQHAVENAILLSLPNAECRELFPKLEFAALPLHSVLNEAGENIKHAYFVNGGLGSVLTMLSDGKSVEVGLTGAEGFVGVPLIAGLRSSHTRTLMQIAGTAFRIKADDLRTAIRQCPQLMRRLLRYAQQLAMQASQIGACNRVHSVDERLARWLLMSQDRLAGDVVPLTQEFLSHMLGTRRASVTVAAGILQKAGLISYSRGSLKIDDRAGLERASCECYRSIVNQTKKWNAESD